MDFILELLKVTFLGIVQGITEWLPISSTGHMILVDKFLNLQGSASFISVFMVVIQFGSIIAVVLLYWNKLNPLKKKDDKFYIEHDVMSMWMKVIVGCIPAAIVGVFFDDFFEKYFYNPVSIAIMLIIFGVLFIVVENNNKGKKPKINSIAEMSYQTVFIIGVFQLIAAMFPGTSRSGATIVGALMIGVSRYAATEFTFFMSVPVMFGASLLKIVKAGFAFTGAEVALMLAGMFVAFIVSVVAIRFLLNYIKKNDFKLFGWYRIILGIIVLVFSFV